jgi:ubiquinone/menaquinone biosynthesis C-methylase UbiE
MITRLRDVAQIAPARRFGRVFHEVAAEYDRSRPVYPDELVDRACRVASLGSGDRVLEVGCGTGQLTRSLVARGSHVTAVEPGKRLIALAEENVRDGGEMEFVNARFEDAGLPPGHYRAVFSAAVFQWIDPEVSWRKAARVLTPGGTLALVQCCGLKGQQSDDDQQALLTALARIAPELAAGWRPIRSSMVAMLITARRSNAAY